MWLHVVWYWPEKIFFDREKPHWKERTWCKSTMRRRCAIKKTNSFFEPTTIISNIITVYHQLICNIKKMVKKLIFCAQVWSFLGLYIYFSKVRLGHFYEQLTWCKQWLEIRGTIKKEKKWNFILWGWFYDPWGGMRVKIGSLPHGPSDKIFIWEVFFINEIIFPA